MKRLIMTGTVLAAAVSLAMPTKKDFKVAEPIVAELMAPAVADYKAKRKTAAEVGEISVQFAQKAETEAAKFLLYRGAVNYLTRGEEYDKAVDATLALQAAIPDIPAEDLAEVVSRATVRATDKKAPRLFALYRKLKTQAASSADAKKYEKMLKTSPDDLPMRRKYAEALAAAGSWKAALAEFAKLKDNAAKFAKAELDGTAKAYEAGEYWWAYEPTYDKADETFKAHAAAFYRQALGSSEITGLRVELVKHRIEPYADEPSTVLQNQIELKTGGNSPFTVSGNRATLTLKNGAKLEFVKCPPGKMEVRWASVNPNVSGFGRLERKKAFISRPYWITTVPVKNVDVDPETKEPRNKYLVNTSMFETFVSQLNEELRTWLPQGYVIRLPSLAEWDYAFRANSTDAHDPYVIFYDQIDLKHQSKTAPDLKRAYNAIQAPKKGVQGDVFGSEALPTQKNAWGIHEYRCTWERVLDCVDESLIMTYDKKALKEGAGGKRKMGNVSLRAEMLSDVDPLFWSEGQTEESLRISRVVSHAGVAARTTKFHFGTIRLVIGPDLVSEWRAKHAKK